MALETNVNDALAHLQRAAVLDPKMTKTYFAIGSIAEGWCGIDDGDPLCQVAIDAYEKLVELEPSREDAWKRLAYAFYGINRIDEAEMDYRRALSLDANDPEVLGGLAALDMQAASRNVAHAKAEHEAVTGRGWIGSPFYWQVRKGNLARVDEGIAFATKARELKNRNVGLMGFLGVLYATRAQLQCGDLKRFKSDTDIGSKSWKHLRRKMRQEGDQRLQYKPAGPPPPPPAHHWWNLAPALR
jgi:tetratricopeptide (TPR) repeat protein